MNLRGIDLKQSYLYDTLKVLADIDPELRKAAKEQMRTVAGPLVQSVQGLIPSQPPMSGWARSKRTRWESATVRAGVRAVNRTKRSSRDGNIPLLSIVQANAAGSIFELAKQAQPARKPRTQKQNDQFVANLNSRFPAARSRYMWPGVEAAMPAVEAALVEAVAAMSDTINGRL